MATATNAQRKVFDINIGRSLLLERLASGSQRSAPISQWESLISNMPGFAQEERDLVSVGILNAGSDAGARYKVESILARGYRELQRYVPVVSSYTTTEFRPTVGVKATVGELPKSVESRARRFVDAANACFKHPSLGYWVVKTGYEDLATRAPNWIVLDNKGRLLTDPANDRAWFQSDVKALDVMHIAIRHRFKNYGGERAFLRFDRYTMPAGSNHREWLVQIPDWRHHFASEHFRVDNLLVHIRTTERKTVSGEQILFVEEIQSDWHAEVRRAKASAPSDARSRRAPIHVPPFKNTWHELGVKVALSIASKQGFTKVGFTNARAQTDRWGNLEGLRRLYDQSIPKTLDTVAKKYGCALGWDGIITRQRNVEIRPVGDGEWIVRGRRTDDVTPRLRLDSVAQYYADQRSKVVSERVRVLSISDSLEAILSADALPIFGW
ncbi:MAG: hypothetical protein ING68_09110 [Rhodocyclaceae bacterium]|jgi:hypothetical protein|nr:hypothetical protein [Rhodocyclaceae bacterium]MCA3022308.1 hypothetical protein [Rhodocyclaceae bacterium]